jgi:hypothetical protein
MNAEEFKTKTVNVMRAHANELDSMEEVIVAATKADIQIPNLKEIFKEISDTAQECQETLNFYDEDDPLPKEVRVAMKRAQEALNHCASALVLYLAVPRS